MHPPVFKTLLIQQQQQQQLLLLLLLLLHSFNGLFSRTTSVSRYQKGKTNLDLNEARDDGVLRRQWHQLDHVQTICTLLQTDSYTDAPSFNFYRPDALPDAQPAVSEHWRHYMTFQDLADISISRLRTWNYSLEMKTFRNWSQVKTALKMRPWETLVSRPQHWQPPVDELLGVCMTARVCLEAGNQFCFCVFSFFVLKIDILLATVRNIC